MDALASTTHFHIFTWVVGIILFLVAAVMAERHKRQKNYTYDRTTVLCFNPDFRSIAICQILKRRRGTLRSEVPAWSTDNRYDGNGTCTFRKRKKRGRCMGPVFRFPIRYNVPRIQIASWHQLVRVTNLIRNVTPAGR